MERGRGVRLLVGGFNSPVAVAVRLMGVEREVRLLRMLAVMMVEVRVVLNRGEVCTTVSIVVRMWTSPDLTLLRSSRWTFILVGEVSSLCCSLLLLLVRHPCTLVREVAVVSSSTHVVMRVMSTSLCAHLCTNRRWCLIGCSRARTGLLDGSQTTFSHAMWRSITPGAFGHFIILQCLLLPQWGSKHTALCSSRKYLWPPG